MGTRELSFPHHDPDRQDGHLDQASPASQVSAVLRQPPRRGDRRRRAAPLTTTTRNHQGADGESAARRARQPDSPLEHSDADPRGVTDPEQGVRAREGTPREEFGHRHHAQTGTASELASREPGAMSVGELGCDESSLERQHNFLQELACRARGRVQRSEVLVRPGARSELGGARHARTLRGTAKLPVVLIPSKLGI
jgi:hypothetical protein